MVLFQTQVLKISANIFICNYLHQRKGTSLITYPIHYSNADIMDDPSPPPPYPADIPDEAVNAKVPMEALYRVLHHGESASGDSHRFSVQADPEDSTSRVRKFILPPFTMMLHSTIIMLLHIGFISVVCILGD